MSPEDPRHGSYAGFVQHRKDGESNCPRCAYAQVVYMRAWRDKQRAGLCAMTLGRVPGMATGLGWPLRKVEYAHPVAQ